MEEKFIPGKLHTSPGKEVEAKKLGESQKRLKDLVKKAYEAEIRDKERALGRSLTEEEKRGIKITIGFLSNWHKKGLIPHETIFRRAFGSLAHLAELLELPATYKNEIKTYYAFERPMYIRALRDYIKAHNPSRTELILALRKGEIPEVSEGIFNHIGFDVLDIEIRHRGSTEQSFSNDDMITAVKKAFEEKCRLEALKLNKESLTEKEKERVKLKVLDYKLFREKGVLGKAPHNLTLVRRLGKEFGPSWDDVLKKSGLL